MSFIFSGLAPHPPILIPDIGKEETNKVSDTISAFHEMEGDLYVLQPEIIFIISPHSLITPEAFSLNLAIEFKSDFSKFGSNEKELTWKCDLELMSKIKERADLENVAVNTISQPILDHGVCVPLYFLTQHLPNVKIIPISFSLLDKNAHIKFGMLLQKVAGESNKRIAIIASGDLSHCLSESAPGGFNSNGQTFDHLLIQLLEQNKIDEIVKISPELIESAGECGYRSLLILLGALKKVDFKFKKLSYEGPFGVGYLVGEFVLS
ncbi:MAG: AmmeMemoRadiSam system protein B [Patescibacteria group bacterium]